MSYTNPPIRGPTSARTADRQPKPAQSICLTCTLAPDAWTLCNIGGFMSLSLVKMRNVWAPRECAQETKEAITPSKAPRKTYAADGSNLTSSPSAWK